MDRYQIEPIAIGEGGFGKVRKGKDLELDRPVAVKTLDPVWTEAEDADKERFRREAKILAKLAHPNIPAIYDISFGSNFHIVFQFIDGNNLRTILSSEPPSISEVRSWFAQVASALQHAHDNGIIHRDIKPENLIVTADRRHCYLVDFGLALSKADLQRLTPSSWVVGTTGYMSPEQENGQDLDPSDDLYVLGMCLYEALCGHRIAVGSYEDLNTQNDTIPPSLDELILSCIQAKPNRLSSASEFGRKLELAFQTHAPLSTILGQGQLYEVIGAIRNMSPTEFMNLPIGQRRLILRRGADVIASPDARLAPAKGEFLAVLTILGVQLACDDYRAVVGPAVDYGFARVSSSEWVGDRRVRDALVQASGVVAKDNHRVIVETLLAWMGGRQMTSQENWFLDAARRLIQPLMANGNCNDSDAIALDKLLGEVNQLQRERQHTVETRL